MKKSISIALSCAIGAGLGFLIAKAFGVFWMYQIFGLLIGSVAGYLIYDLPTVLAAIPKAWDYAQNSISNFDSKMFKKIIIDTGKTAYVCVIYILFFAEVVIATLSLFERPGVLSAVFLILIVGSYGWGSYFLLHVISIWDTTVMKERKMLKHLRYAKITWAVFLAKRSMVHGFVLVLLSPLVGFICGVHFMLEQFFLVFPKFLGKQIRFAGKFLWEFFKLIHSDMRLLVGIDSFLGGLVGLYFQNILVGMIVGAVWGFFNYYIVGIKLLKLTPKH